MKMQVIGFDGGELKHEVTEDRQTVYTLHLDPGHGWLEVARAELVKLGILDQISAYSYQQGDRVYLEEDCDAGTFVEAMEAAGVVLGVTEGNVVESHRENTPIRNYQHFTF